MTRINEAVECLESLGYTVTPPGPALGVIAPDYKAETERLIKFAESNGSVSAATAAVATATLYLAEQQRIANIIALAHTDQDEAARAALWEMTDDGFMAHYVLRDNIAEGLGL